MADLDDIIQRVMADKLGTGHAAGGKRFRYTTAEDAVRTLFPRYAFVAFSPNHSRFWEYVDKVTVDSSPPPVALVLPRGQGKSTSAEMAAALLMALKRRRFIVYCCATQERANEHVQNIATLLESPEVQAYFPEVGAPKVGLHGNQKAWRQAELRASNGTIIRALGFDGAMRGIKIEGFRPDCIIIDDVDEITDGPEVIRKKINVLTKSIIPAKATNCWFVIAQNLIHAHGIVARLVRREADFLQNLECIGPVKAIENFTYEVDPRTKHVTIIGGEASWPEGMGLDVCQRMIDEMGLEAFLTECQQEVDRMSAGSIYPMWDPCRHLIEQSEFIALVGLECLDDEGSLVPPNRWRAALGHDWGSTMKHPACASVWVTPDAAAKQWGIEDIRFKWAELTRPRKREEVKQMTPINYGEELVALTADYYDQLEWLVMSHEASSERNTYAQHLSKPLTFSPSKAGRIGGLAQMQSFLAIDWSRPHPFRVYPDGYLDPETGEDLSGKPLMGCPRAIWVVGDGHATLEVAPDGGLCCGPGEGDVGMERGRWEMERYHWLTSVDGTEKQLPYALDNDMMDADRYVAWASFPSSAPLTVHQRVLEIMHEKYPNLTNPVEQDSLDIETKVQIETARMIQFNKTMNAEVTRRAQQGSAVRRRRPGHGGRRRDADY